jgi:hypothetical protein
VSLVVVLAGCGSADSGAAAAPVTRDSAGVTIVETAAPVWGDASPWRVDSAPLLSIGNEDGEDAYLFSRISGATRRDDGSIVVGDGFGRELRVFDASGRHVSSHGRRGEGPGEFTFLSRLARCGPNELWVDTDGRLSIWRLDSLAFVREFTLPDNAMWPLICFDGAGLLVQQSRGINPDAAPQGTPYTDSLQFKVVDATGAPRSTLFTLPLWEYILVMTPEGGRGFRTPFGRMSVYQANGERLVVGLAAEMRLDEYDLDGRWVRSLRGPDVDLAIGDEARQAYTNAPLTRSDSMTREWYAVAGSPFPDRMPAYDNLLRDPDGHLWVRRFAVPGTSRGQWGVFAPNGEFLGHVTLPTDLEVHEIGRDYVLGAVFADDVPQVRLYRLTR